MAPIITGTPKWQRYLLAGLVAISLYFLLPRGGLAQALVFVGVHLSAIAAVIAGIRANRPRFALPWGVIVVGQVLYGVANLIWYPYRLAFDVDLGFPSVADALYVPGYTIVTVGIAMMMWRRAGGDRTSVIDAAIVMVGVGGLSWVFLMAPHVEDPTTPGFATAVAIAYPLIDVFILGAVMLVAFRPGAHSTAYGLLCLGVVSNLAAGTNLMLTTLDGTFSLGAPYFAGWMLFFVLLGTTALHPSMRDLSEPAPAAEPVLSRPRLAFLSAAALIGPLTLLVAEIIEPARGRPVLALLSTVLFVLVLVRISGLMSDITQRKRVEKAKDEFLSVVSHELRTPLTSIRGALGLLASGAMGELAPKGQRMLEIACSNTDRLVRLINDILDIERMESGRATLQREICDAADLVTRTVEAIRPAAEEDQVTLSATAAPVPVFADPDRILQALINLVHNAVKFSPAGSTVRVSAERRDGEVLFSVTDQGRGIPGDKLELVFGRFQQVDASDSRQKGGTGLGLAICRSIVSQHGGRIWAESAPGEGSTFSFTLPALPGPEPAAIALPHGRPSILVCDDEPEVLEVVTAMLDRWGYAVIPATSGRHAVEAAVAGRPDAILLDLIMPGMSGWDTIAALKGNPETADIPLIALSVLGREQGASGPAVVDGWIGKPIDETALFTALKNVLTDDAGTTKVLVVEDDPGLAQVLNAMFERHGLVSFHAQTVQQAVEMGARVRPDLLVLDLMLPDGDGFQIVQSFRKDDHLRRIPVIVYTAKELDPAERGALELGHTEVLTKGRVTPAELERRLGTLLDGMLRSAEKERAQA